jgi:uncharacterized protein
MSRLALMIMAKAPQPGAVKTRLSPPLDSADAARLYECFLRDKIEAVRGIAIAQPVIAYTPPGAGAVFRRLAPGFELVAQRGDDLGSRLSNAFDRLFEEGYTGVVALDSDTPTLPAEIMRRAAERLAAARDDVVLGPTEDGGYYLVGLRRPHRELFQGIAWSTPRVMPQTLRRVRDRGLRAFLLPEWFDVDTAEDLRRLREALNGASLTHSAHTKRFLLELEA